MRGESQRWSSSPISALEPWEPTNALPRLEFRCSHLCNGDDNPFISHLLVKRMIHLMVPAQDPGPALSCSRRTSL